MKFSCNLTDTKVEITSACTIPEIYTCITVIVNKLYCEMPENLAGAFKFALKTAFAADVPFKSDDELEKEQDGEKEKELYPDAIVREVMQFMKGKGHDKTE